MKKSLGKLLAAMMLMTLMASLTVTANAGMDFYRDLNGVTHANFYYRSDDLIFSPKLKNSADSNINYIELAVFCTDEDFNPIYPDDGESDFARYFDSTKGYRSGRIAPFGDCRISGCRDASYVFCAIVRYRYRNGETVELADPSQTSILDMYDWTGWAF